MMNQNTFLTELRERTGPMHKKLEQTSVSQRIVSPSLDMESYRNYLKKVYSLHHGVEKDVFPLISHLVGDVDDRKKTATISCDLEQVGVHVVDEQKKFTDSKFIADAAFCMGIMYVSEGSTLGGLYIVKNVGSTLGASAEQATGFLTVYGEQTGSRWKKFLQELETFQSSCDETTRQRIIDGAIYGFERTYDIFNN